MAISRRGFFGSTLAAGAAAALPATPARAEKTAQRYQNGISPWPLALNASTVRPAPLKDKVAAAAGAGWDAIELWIDDLEKHEQGGGNLQNLGKQIRDLRLPPESVLMLIIRDGTPMVPSGQAVLRAGDEIIALTKGESEGLLRELLLE